MASDDTRPRPNNLGKMYDALFAELARLDAVDAADEDALKAEVERSRAIQGVAREINGAASTMMRAAEFRAEWAGVRQASVPAMLDGGA